MVIGYTTVRWVMWQHSGELEQQRDEGQVTGLTLRARNLMGMTNLAIIIAFKHTLKHKPQLNKR